MNKHENNIWARILYFVTYEKYEKHALPFPRASFFLSLRTYLITVSERESLFIFLIIFYFLITFLAFERKRKEARKWREDVDFSNYAYI